MSFDIDDEDREHHYRQYGRPRKQSTLPSLASLRRSRIPYYALIACGLFALIYLLSGRQESAVDWKRFAYSLYATDSHSLCNAILVMDSMRRLGTKANTVLLYPQQWDTTVHSKMDRTSQLLGMARDTYKAQLYPIQLLGENGVTEPGTLNSESGWDTSITKLLAFDLIFYDRVIHLDSDITLLKNLDHLFLLPKTPIAMPRAYWSDVSSKSDDQAQPWPLTSLLMVLEPSRTELRYMLETLTSWRIDSNFTSGKKYDMDLLNYRFGSSALVLPQRPYALLTAEFRRPSHDHSTYLGVPDALVRWDAQKAFDEAYLVHFSDWPLPKPWTMWPPEGLAEIQPNCTGGGGACAERRIWKGLYEDFRKKRKEVCKILSVPAPQWSLVVGKPSAVSSTHDIPSPYDTASRGD
ncbi:hypothetical protein LTR95_010135 [Oleoguttula sp. CCFEE 5521]